MVVEPKRMHPHVRQYGEGGGKVPPTGSGYQHVSWDAVYLQGDFPICIGNSAGVGSAKISFAVERVPSPHLVM